MKIIEGRKITKRFMGLLALEEVDFELNKGEILGLIGPNGSGKTTLINVITGFYKPTSGKVIYKNRDISGLAPYKISRLGIGRTFQIVKPFMELSVLENVTTAALFGKNIAMPKPKAIQIANSSIEAVGLHDKSSYKPGALSIAELKKLEIAKAIALSPDVLFLDESMAGLNPKETEAAMELVLKIREQRNLSIFFVEHVMKVVMGISDRVMVLHHGRKIADGKPNEVVKDENVIKAYLGKRYKEQKNA